MRPSTIRATSLPNVLDVPEAHLGVLDRVVQEGRGERRGVQLQVREYPRHGHRVLDVGSPERRNWPSWASSAYR